MMPSAETRPPKVSRRTLVALAALLVIVVGIVIVAVAREASSRRLVAAVSRPVKPPRPALTRDEEKYIQALWPIHGAVERSSARMSLGQIFYITKDLDRGELKERVGEALTTYRGAGIKLRALEAPPSLQRAHEDYTAAVGLFEKSAVEVQKMFEDGRDDHMRIAAPFSREANDKIREVGAKFWPHEFPPN